jgi:hypothetical protein
MRGNDPRLRDQAEERVVAYLVTRIPCRLPMCGSLPHTSPCPEPMASMERVEGMTGNEYGYS